MIAFEQFPANVRLVAVKNIHAPTTADIDWITLSIKRKFEHIYYS